MKDDCDYINACLNAMEVKGSSVLSAAARAFECALAVMMSKGGAEVRQVVLTPLQRQDTHTSKMFIKTVQSLQDLPRSGWIKAGVPKVENVAEHSYNMAWMILNLPEKYTAGVDIDKALCLKRLDEIRNECYEEVIAFHPMLNIIKPLLQAA